MSRWLAQRATGPERVDRAGRDRRHDRHGGYSRTDERGFTLTEVVLAMVVLGIVGAAATNLVLRLTSPREATIRYEQRSLAARMAAEHVWDLFAHSQDDPPEECLPPSDDPPPQHSFAALDANYEVAFRCGPYEEDGEVSEELYRVWVWVRRSSDGELVGAFNMLALVGGY